MATAKHNRHNNYVKVVRLMFWQRQGIYLTGGCATEETDWKGAGATIERANVPKEQEEGTSAGEWYKELDTGGD